MGQEDVTGWSEFREQDETGEIRKKTETEEGKEEGDEGRSRERIRVVEWGRIEWRGEMERKERE